MKVLITGGSGFIGSHTVRLATSQGYDVTVLDLVKNRNLEGIKYKFVQGNILDEELVKELVKNNDGVIHLAANTNIIESFNNTQEYLKTNIDGSEFVYKAAQKENKRLVFASSSSVYESKDEPINEHGNISPLSPYASSKWFVDRCLSDKYPEAVVLRYFNVYGEGAKSCTLLQTWLEAASQGYRTRVWGDGTQTRGFVWVGDVARANLWALRTKQKGTFNVVAENHELGRLGREFSKIFKTKLKFEPEKKVFHMFNAGDNSKISHHFEFTKTLSEWLKKDMRLMYLKNEHIAGKHIKF